MNTVKKDRSDHELRRIEDGLVESVLSISSSEYRAEMEENGEDTAAYVALGRAMIADAQRIAGRERMAAAKANIVALKARPATSGQGGDAAARLAAFKSRPESPLMMAARKDTKLSASDEDAVADALAELERLERENYEG